MLEMSKDLKSEIKTTWNGWSVNPKPSPCSLGDVMSEELAKEMEKNSLLDTSEKILIEEKNQKGSNDENKNILTEKIVEEFLINNSEVNLPGKETEKNDTSNDLLIAMMLQHELDQEFDQQLRREQQKSNGSSKVQISYDNHRSVHPYLHEDQDLEIQPPNPKFKIKKDTTPQFNRQGISGKGKNLVTKHDHVICSRKNAFKVMENFPPEFPTGNDLNFDMRLPNKVYNSLKLTLTSEGKRGQRNHEKKDHSTKLSALDTKTKLLLYKIINNNIINNLNGIFSTGKESVILHAEGGSSPNQLIPREMAVKVFKTTLSSFKNRCFYIKGDVRFFKDHFKKQNPRKIMKMWAEKEEINLKRMQRFGIPCPEPILLKKHILLMSFIGQNQNPAPKLQEVDWSCEDIGDVFLQLKEIMKTLYKKCNLVHSDLSEFNLLLFNKKLFVIDVAQSVDVSHNNSYYFLARDCQNVINFFEKKGLKEKISWQNLFNEITNLNIKAEEHEFLAQLQKKADDEPTMKLGVNKNYYPFNYFFEKTYQNKNNKKINQYGEENDEDEEEEEDEDEEEEENEEEDEENEEEVEDEEEENEENDEEEGENIEIEKENKERNQKIEDDKNEKNNE